MKHRFGDLAPLGNTQSADTLGGGCNIHSHRKACGGQQHRQKLLEEFIVAIGSLNKNLALVFGDCSALVVFYGLSPLGRFYGQVAAKGKRLTILTARHKCHKY